MLDQPKIAKVLGVILFIYSFYNLYGFVPYFSPSQLDTLTIIAISANVLGVIVGVGLFLSKAWAVWGTFIYGLSGVLLLSISYLMYKTLDVITPATVVIEVFVFIVFLWLFSGIKRFK